MPTYQTNKTYRGGFYNNKVVNGANDRVYNAADMRKPYDTVFTDGIMPEADGTAGNTLKVTSAGGMVISVAAGNAKLGGAWFENTSAFNITLDTAGSTDRYDCIIIQNDDSEDVRAPKIYVKSLSTVPTISNLTRAGNVHEICVAYVRVPAFAVSISDENITDTREDGGLCNTMSGVGATVVRTYHNTYFSETQGQTEIPIGIPQFNASRDRLTVIVEGRTFSLGANYTVVDNEKVRLVIGLPVVGTRIDFEVAKNVNAAGADTVVQEVAQLRGEMTAANKKIEHHYYCNGLTDNVGITNVVRDFLSGGDYGSMRLVVHGHFGASNYLSGKGDLNDPYRWFDFSVESNRRVVLDFSDCSQLEIPIAAGFYNYIFYGSIRIEGATVIANELTQGTACQVFGRNTFVYYARDCRFYVSANMHSYIANCGTFENCRGSIANGRYYSYCFYPTDDSLLRVIGGEYYSYRGDSSRCAVVGHAGAAAVTILYGMNAPTLERAGYTQQYAVYQQNASGTGVLSCTDLVSTLPIEVISGFSNIRGTIALNKAGKM